MVATQGAAGGFKALDADQAEAQRKRFVNTDVCCDGAVRLPLSTVGSGDGSYKMR